MGQAVFRILILMIKLIKFGPINLHEWFPSLQEPLIFLRIFPEHLNVTTLRGLSIIESPVAGFLPRRSFLSFTQNLPKPLTRTSSPDARVVLMISMSCSISSVLFFCGNPSCWWTDSMMSALVRAIFGVL